MLTVGGFTCSRGIYVIDYRLLGGSPGCGFGVGEFAVADAGKFDQVDAITGRAGGVGIASALLDRDHPVSLPVQCCDRDADGKMFDRRGNTVSIRVVGRHAAQKISNKSILAGCGREFHVEDTGHNGG